MTDSESETTDRRGRIGRRTLIRGGVVVTGVGLAGALAPDAAGAATGQPFILGQVNAAETPTILQSSFEFAPGLAVQAPASVGVLGTSGSPIDPNEILLGAGVYGFASATEGVRGRSLSSAGVLGTFGADAAPSDPNTPDVGAGVFGFAEQGIGVRGRSGNVGVLGTSGVPNDPNEVLLGAGVYGFAADAVGVRGRSGTGLGVLGTTGDPAPQDPNDVGLGAGVYGLSTDAATPGMRAEHRGGGVGLEVNGRTMLSTAGRNDVGANKISRRINHAAVRANSVVLVTLNTDPDGIGLAYVRVGNGSFTVVLETVTPKSLSFSYLVLN